ncbi:unnamed protein product [Clonostachys byssicola]|uniref:Kelch repeat protein n=1 Tax=Clonostachys byssicola TaxID=160290 RepID=A0A9N9Y787_9HYPO|nr:unnamed protein product [Clonostachys byssicola]
MKFRVLLLAALKIRSVLSDPSPSEEVFRRNGLRGTTTKDTFAIDISKSWDPKDAKFLKLASETRKKGVYRSGLVADENTQAIYLWGGRRDIKPLDRQLWKLLPDGKGNGTWSSEITTGIAGVVSTESSAHTVAHGLGFWFGGSTNELTERTSNAAAVGTSVPGFVSYNFTAKTWTNHTNVPDAVKSPWAASATFVPTFGPNGVIALIGGLDSANSPVAINFGTIYLMDPVTMVWYSQTVSGAVSSSLPTRRMDHCVVGVQGDNNTYEIFMYGGAKDRSNEEGKGSAFGDVWVLSLPGFVWHRADGAGINPRTHHACVRAGNRQILSIGGVNTSDSDGMSTKDSLPQGLGIFDMTKMEWKETYDAGAEPYATPEIIKKWYADG